MSRGDYVECRMCGHTQRAMPVCGDDWDGEETAVYPDCPSCEEPMEAGMCSECGKYPADQPSSLCAGCGAYQEHRS